MPTKLKIPLPRLPDGLFYRPISIVARAFGPPAPVVADPPHLFATPWVWAETFSNRQTSIQGATLNPVPDRPTSIRYGMIAITTFVALMLYLDRVCLSIVGSSIRKDLQFSEEQFAWLLSAFFWAYALCQIPTGWIGDRHGPRVVLAVWPTPSCAGGPPCPGGDWPAAPLPWAAGWVAP